MRHLLKDNHLGRTESHRKALFSNMTSALLMNKRIVTTLPKAKALRRYVEPLITKAKTDTTHSRRTVFAYLKNKFSVKELFTEIGPKVKDRPGGYTRILKLGPRKGDGAEMALIELVDYNEYITPKKESRRSKRRKKANNYAPKPVEPTPTPIVQQEQTLEPIEAEPESLQAAELQPSAPETPDDNAANQDNQPENKSTDA